MRTWNNKKKDERRQTMNDGYVLIYGGVDQKYRAKSGVGCVIHGLYGHKIQETKYISKEFWKYNFKWGIAITRQHS